ncbi:MAG: quinolinate synthase NadA, partial [Neisseria sicca]
SCAFCPWMAMNSLGGIKYALTSGHNEILLDRKLGEAAKLPLQRMLDFAAGLKPGDVFNGMGPA